MVKFKRKKKNPRLEGLSPVESTFVKLYSLEEMELLKTFEVDKLKQIVAETNAHTMKAKKEMEENPEFQKAKEVMDTFRASYSDVKKFADAKKILSLHLLQAKGVVDCGAEEEA